MDFPKRAVFSMCHLVSYNSVMRCYYVTSRVWYPPKLLVVTSRMLRSLQSNNLQCDCNTKWLKAWLLKKRIKAVIFCEQPASLKGSNVTGLEDKYFERCGMLIRFFRMSVNIKYWNI